MEESSGAPTAVVAFSRSSDHTTVRDSIKDVFAELQNDDEGVRPSVVAAALKAKQTGVTTTSINAAPPDTPKSHDVDYDAVQALLAALSFTPSESSVSSSSDDGSSGVKKRFDFASPVKNAPSTPWVKRVQTTPPTASTTYDEEEDDEDVSQMAITPSLEKHTNHHETPMRDTSDSAAAVAYPQSLPNKDTSSHADDNVSTVSSPRGRRHSNKPCKKFPKVSTDIPGAGVTRSSVGLKKGAVKLPFVHIAGPGGEGETVALRKHHQQHHPALHIYQHAKEAWAWGKGNALLISPIMGMAEGIVGMAAGITGQGDLETVDHNLMTPLVSAVDDVILGPVAHVIGGVLSGLFGGGGEDHDGRN